MKINKYIIGFLGGFLLFLLIAAVFLPRFMEEKYEYGKYHGTLEIKNDLANKIEQRFGMLKSGESYNEVLFSIKTTDVVITESNGTKTLRIIK